MAIKMDNLEEMDRFLEKFNILRLKQEEIKIINNPITSTEIEAVIKNPPKKQKPKADGFTGKIYQTFREKLMPILLKFFQKLQRKEHFQTHSRGHHHPDTKTRQKQHKKRKLRANLTDEHRCKNQQNFSKQNSATHQKAHTP